MIKLLIILYSFLILFNWSCSSKNDKSNIAKPVISELRVNPDPNPVASYIVPMGDPKLERKFGVRIFETPFTFKYLLSMEYDGMQQDDTLSLPDFEKQPIVVIKPGNDKLSCIIGFLDDQKNFRPYKQLSASDGQLKLKVLNSYTITTK